MFKIPGTIRVQWFWLAMWCAFFVWPHASVAGMPAVSVADVTAALFGDIPLPSEWDVNQDGRVTAADIVSMEIGAITPPSPTMTLSTTPAASTTASPSVTSTLTPTASPTSSATPTTNGVLFSGTISQLVPHGLNDTFNYNITGPGTQTTTETDKIVSVDENGDFTVDLKQGSAEKQDKYSDTGTQLFFYEEDGIAPAPATTTPCTPALLRLSMPVTVGQTSSTTSTCTIHYPPPTLPTMFSVTETVTPMELLDELTVAAGTFTNVVHIHGTRSYGNETDEIYLAPGVGIIHRVQVQKIGSITQTITTDLSGATVGGQPVVPK